MQSAFLHRLAHKIAAARIASMTREACIIATGDFGGSRCLVKNRDRNYVPELRLYHEVRNGVEVLYVRDEVTGWVEGMNEYGIGIVNAALMVGHDEAEKKLVKTVGKKSKDGARVLKALAAKTVEQALEVAQTYQGGIKGHTFVSNPSVSYALEMTSKHDASIRKLNSNHVHVRTNHGMAHPGAGYTEGPDLISSQARREQAKKVLQKVDRPQDLAPAIYGKRKGDKNDPNNMVRDTEKMRTTSQMVLDLTTKVVYLYLIPGKVEYLGCVNNLPKGFKPKLKVKIFDYTDIDGDGEFDVIRRRKRASELLPLMDPAFNLREAVKHMILLEDHLLHPDRQCMDCIWKHLLTVEAFADEAATLTEGVNPVPADTGARMRAISVALRTGMDLAQVGQLVRTIRKGLLPAVANGRV